MISKMCKIIKPPKRSRRSGQVTLYLIGIMATLVSLTFVVINLGKIVKDKTYADNAADSGALTAATIIATAFNLAANYNWQQNNSGSDRSMKNEFVFPNGSTGWFELRIEPVPEGILILSIDITERENIEKALRESEEK